MKIVLGLLVAIMIGLGLYHDIRIKTLERRVGFLTSDVRNDAKIVQYYMDSVDARLDKLEKHK